ncbi:MAG: Gfo/Idh/MocA family oxidoreductase [Planctomycetes bacterium]|nr:Gfo/Idh/MocA family oxidoreductase [Planctomycetota bacterium]
MNRRTFLRTSAIGSAGLLLLRDGAIARAFRANEKLRLAHIGAGGRGRELLGSFSNMEAIAALCDVNQVKAAEMYKKFPDVPKFKDFRAMIDKMGDRIDAVVVATPDHTHAVATSAAIRAGKHVYTEKPLTRTVEESRILRALASKHGVATSMGNQGTASGPFRRALELIREGLLGEIREVYVWNDQGGPGWDEAPRGEEPIPPSLEWDLWLGPARDRPFHSRWLQWHGWRDFGTGNLGNWASHTSNLAFMALRVDSLWRADPDAKAIIRVQAKVDAIHRLSLPRWERVVWEIPARGDLPPLRFSWNNGSRAPGMREEIEAVLGRGLDWGDKGEKKWADWAGCLIVGAKGKILSNGHNTTFSLLPEDAFKDVRKDRPERAAYSRGHERDWLDACRGGERPWASFDYAGPLTEFNMLGNVATLFEGPLEYDPIAGKITNDPKADEALRFECRKGWSLTDRSS